MNPILIVFLVLLYFAVNSGILLFLATEEDKRIMRLFMFLFGLPMGLVAMVSIGIFSIIFINSKEE